MGDERMRPCELRFLGIAGVNNPQTGLELSDFSVFCGLGIYQEQFALVGQA
jgi:hypothetical protein